MLGIGLQELLVILLVALLVVGPKRLPQAARTLAKALRELRKAADEVRSTLEAEELQQELEKEKRDFELLSMEMKDTINSAKTSSSTELPKHNDENIENEGKEKG